MKKWMSMMLCVLLLAFTAAAGICETLYVDNRETDKVYPERLNLRAEASKSGGILGLYYTGAPVNVLERKEDYAKVEIGGVTGYMALEYLITQEEAQARYGAGSFGDCRAAQVDLTGMWMQGVVLRSQTDVASDALMTLNSGQQVQLVGILDNWAYIAVPSEDGQKTWGYVPLDVLTDVGEYKTNIVSSGKADMRTIVYDAPNNRGEEVMALYNGVACFNLFGRKEGEWRKVRVGGVSGWIKYTQADNLYALGNQSRAVVPYYPLLMQTKDDALLYSVMGDKSKRYMTLGEGMKVELLAECGQYGYVRTYEGGAGAYECGDFGYVLLSSLSIAVSGESVGVAQADNGDLPVLMVDAPETGANVLGALCAGAQLRLVSYTQTDYVQVSAGNLTGYLPKDEVRILSGSADAVSERIVQRATTREEITMQDAPGASGKAVETVESGRRVYMLGKFGEWALVLAADSPRLGFSVGEDHVGFVQLAYLNAPASTTHLTAYATTDKVNLRSSGDRNGAIIGRVRLTERLRVADYGANWTCVVTPDGKRGYVMTDYLKFE